MTTEGIPGSPLEILEPVPCSECGRTISVGKVARLVGWQKIIHWFDCRDAVYDDDWDDDL